MEAWIVIKTSNYGDSVDGVFGTFATEDGAENFSTAMYEHIHEGERYTVCRLDKPVVAG